MPKQYQGEWGGRIGAFEGDAVYDSGVLYEARYGYSPFDFFNVELSLGVIDTEMYTRQASAASTVNVTTTAPRSTRLTTASISTLFFITDARVHPYLLAGVGTLTDEETYLLGNLGIGVGYAVNSKWTARVEGKALLSKNAPAMDRFQHVQLAFD